METTDKVELTLRERDDMIINARKWIMTHDKSMAGVMTYVEYMILDTENTYGVDIAATDGYTVYIGPQFFDLKPIRERAAVIAHEILHVCFRHPQRRGSRHGELWNIAVDAVVNAGLEKLSKYLILPGDYITFEKIIDLDTRRTRADNDWTSESVYEYLLKQAKDGLKQAIDEFKDQNGDTDSKGKKGSGRSNKTLDDLINELVSEIRKNFPDAGRDLLTSKKRENIDLEEKTWESRLNRAMSAGTDPNSILGQLLKEFPKSELPWEALLRQYMKSACLPRTQDNWTRPGRQMLATSSRIFMPGIKQQNGLQKAVVIVDTSGSIYANPKALNAFAAEITAIQKQTGCLIELIYADAAIAATYTIKNDGKSFTQKLNEGKFTPKGGGGTNFIPAIELARQYKPAVVVYLTDGEGVFPSTTYGMNLLWVISTDIKAPVGRTIHLKIK